MTFDPFRFRRCLLEMREMRDRRIELMGRFAVPPEERAALRESKDLIDGLLWAMKMATEEEEKPKCNCDRPEYRPGQHWHRRTCPEY